MDTLSLLIMTLVATSLIYSFFYLYIYKQSKNRYIAIWGFGWVIYSLNYVVAMLAENAFAGVFLKYFFAIVSSFFLLIGTMEFVRSPQVRSAKYISILSSLTILILSVLSCFELGSELFSTGFSFLSSLFLCIISVGTGIVLLLHEEPSQEDFLFNPPKEIVFDITAWAFIIWGIHKGFYDFVTPGYDSSIWNYVSSIILINILNISLVLTYSAQNNNEIRRSENLYRLLTENSKDMIASIKLLPRLEYLYLSPAVQYITGFEANGFYQDPQLFGRLIPEPDRAQYQEYLRNPETIDGTLLFRLNRKDSREIWLEQHSTVFYDADGQPSHVEAILRDVTTRKKVEEKLFHSESSRKKLVANISHELNTPITSIIGYLSVIQDNLLSSPSAYLEYVRICIDKSLMLKALIQDLFELSKFESGQIRFHYERINSYEFFQEIIGKLSPDLEKSCTWEMLTPETHPDDFILIDIMRMEQVFRNLVGNALKHMDSSGHIQFVYDSSGGPEFPRETDAASYVLFTVKDNGTGIPQEELPYIFDRFYRGSNSGSIQGTGLGLSISREIVNSHNGMIWAENIESAGTALYIALPKLLPSQEERS